MCVEPAVVCGKILVAIGEVYMQVVFAHNFKCNNTNCEPCESADLLQIQSKYVQFKVAVLT